MNQISNNAVDIHDLSFSYQQHGRQFQIPQWSIEKGAQVFLYGASGSGKSTLLNLLCGILSPNGGTINLLSQPFSRLPARQRDRFRANHIGVVFQEFNLIPFLTIKENINLAGHFAKANHANTSTLDRALPIFERLKLDKQLFNQRADQLSVGQRQRVSIARALVNQPEILIADEPTSALDSDNRDEFMQLLLETATNANCTVIFVSHDKALTTHFSHTQAIEALMNVTTD